MIQGPRKIDITVGMKLPQVGDVYLGVGLPKIGDPPVGTSMPKIGDKPLGRKMGIDPPRQSRATHPGKGQRVDVMV